MSNGLLGLNVRTLGVSRDQVMSAARQIGGAFILIQDDPDLVTQAKAAGLRTIYRQSGDETLSTPPEPPVIHVPPPTTGGLLRVVKSLPGGIQWRNIRTEPDSDADDIGNLVVGDVITEYETRPDGWGYLSRAKDGVEGWALFKGVVTVPVMPAVWTVNILTPYVSQTDASANVSNNDCGIASMLMLQRAWMVARGLVAADLPPVDDLVPYTALANNPPPKGLTFAQIGALSKQLGYLTQYIQPLTEAQLISFLDAGTPVMVLVSYMVFNPGHGNFAHIAVVSGYSPTQFLCQNPYDNGRDYALPRAQLMQAMSSSPGNSIGYQAMTLTLLA